MISKTDEQMRDEIMVGGQLESMKALLHTTHGGQLEAVDAVGKLLDLAQSLHNQAIMKGYHSFNVFDELMDANDKSAIEAAIIASENKRTEEAVSGSTDGVFKI